MNNQEYENHADAIGALSDSWIAAVANRDVIAISDLLTDDYEIWAHGAPAQRGPQAAAAAMGAALAKFSIDQSFEPLETVVAGDWAFQRGIERMRLRPVDGGPEREMTQRALLILQLGTDGRWRYARGMTNGLPLAEATNGSKDPS
jgi:uncharacterized protein (TIGR02246 family)